jgi:hypothetical protein
MSRLISIACPGKPGKSRGSLQWGGRFGLRDRRRICPTWLETTQAKVTVAINSLQSNDGTGGDAAMTKLLDRYQQSAQQI